MNARTFIRLITKLGRERGVPVHFDSQRGKGSQGTLFYGKRRTVVPRELRKGALHGCLKQLGLTLRDLS